jgi:hypothetical protein
MDTWNSKIKYLQDECEQKLLPERQDKKRYSRLDVLCSGYFIKKQTNYWLLYFIDFDGPHCYQIVPNTEDENPYRGSDAMNAICEKFKELTGKSLYSEFTTYHQNIEIRQEIKKCVPAPVNYARESLISGMGWYSDRFYKNDISSAYPAMASKKLPTLKDFKIVKGRVEPTKDRPFAFYLKSHSMKVLNEFDSRDWVNSEFYQATLPTIYVQKTKYRQDLSIPSDNEQTLLLKASKSSLADVMKHFYDGRQEHPEYKFFMNAFLGYLHREYDPEFPHIAAVVLGRCVDFVLKKAEYIEKNNGVVCLIATDSVAWDGEDIPEITDTKKKLGAFIREYSRCEALIKGPKCYQIKTDTETKTTWAGVSKSKTENLEFGDIITKHFTRPVMKFNNDGTIYIKEIDC